MNQNKVDAYIAKMKEQFGLLTGYQDSMQLSAEAEAKAKKLYHIRLSQELTKTYEHGKLPSAEMAKGNPEVADLREDRDMAKRDYEILNSMIKNTRLKIDAARTLLATERNMGSR